MADTLLKELASNLKQYNDDLDDLTFDLSEAFDYHPLDTPTIPSLGILEKQIKNV